jgi:hypothetical protein
LVGKPEKKIPFGKSKHEWNDNITITLRIIVYGKWIGFVWLRIGTSGGILRTGK